METKKLTHKEWLAAGNPQKRQHGWSRRSDDGLRCPAETAIADAVDAVEDIGASPDLTYCVAELGRIKDHVADIVDALTRTRCMDFSEALQKLKMGKRLARYGWNGTGMFVFLVQGSKFIVNREPLVSILGEGTEVNYTPHIDIKNADGSIAVWTPSQPDLMAGDWVTVD